MDATDLAFHTGLGLVGYATGGVLGAGLALVAGALTTAALVTGGRDE